MRYSECAYVCDSVEDDAMKRLIEKLNDGFEILKLDTHFVPESANVGTALVPCLIAILAKPREVADHAPHAV